MLADKLIIMYVYLCLTYIAVEEALIQINIYRQKKSCRTRSLSSKSLTNFKKKHSEKKKVICFEAINLIVIYPCQWCKYIKHCFFLTVQFRHNHEVRTRISGYRQDRPKQEMMSDTKQVYVVANIPLVVWMNIHYPPTPVLDHE